MMTMMSRGVQEIMKRTEEVISESEMQVTAKGKREKGKGSETTAD